MQRETGWEKVCEDEPAGGAARNPQGERADGGDGEPQWTYKCQRLNRRVQARYRQFPVNPPGGEEERFGEQAIQGGGMAEGEYPGQERQFDIAPGIEVEVEAAPIAGFDEMRAIDTSDLAEPEQDAGTQPTGSQYPGRQGLRAIFATESDRLPEAAEELSAEVRQPRESTEISPAETQEMSSGPETGGAWEIGTGAEMGDQPDVIGRQETGSRQAPYDKTQGQIVWKSFPKPLRDQRNK